MRNPICLFTGSFPPVFVRLLSLLTAIALAGCTISATGHSPETPRPLLQQWLVLSGAQAGASQLGFPGTGYITLRRPTALSARDNVIYLIDSGLNRIFRYNRDQQTLTPFTNLPVSANTRIYTAPDRSVYITEPTRAEVLHFSSDGTQLPSFVSPGNLARPVSVSVDESTGLILVADGLFDQIITFNNMGRTLSVVKPQQGIAIASMATGPDGIYITDRIGRRVVVLRTDGTIRYVLGAQHLGNPGAIAVSRDNLVFVNDNFDQTIKVFKAQKNAPQGESETMLTKVGGPGSGPGSFNSIDGLAVDGSILYIADSLNARVQIMLINQ